MALPLYPSRTGNMAALSKLDRSLGLKTPMCVSHSQHTEAHVRAAGRLSDSTGLSAGARKPSAGGCPEHVYTYDDDVPTRNAASGEGRKQGRADEERRGDGGASMQIADNQARCWQTTGRRRGEHSQNGAPWGGHDVGTTRRPSSGEYHGRLPISGGAHDDGDATVRGRVRGCKFGVNSPNDQRRTATPPSGASVPAARHPGF